MQWILMLYLMTYLSLVLLWGEAHLKMSNIFVGGSCARCYCWLKRPNYTAYCCTIRVYLATRAGLLSYWWVHVFYLRSPLVYPPSARNL